MEAVLCAFASTLQCLQNDSGGEGRQEGYLFRVYVYVQMHVCMYRGSPVSFLGYCQFLRQDHYPGAHQVG